MIGVGYKPVEQPNVQPLWYAPPLELLEKAVANKQLHQDTNRSILDAYKRETNKLRSIEGTADRERHQELENEYRGIESSIINKFNGDLTQVDEDLRNYQMRLEEDFSQRGDAGKIIQSYDNYAKAVEEQKKRYQERKIGESGFWYSIQKSLNDYKKNNGYKSGVYNSNSVRDLIDVEELVRKRSEDWKADTKYKDISEMVSAGTFQRKSPDGMYDIFVDEDGVEYVDYNEVYNSLYKSVMSDPNVMEQYKLDYMYEKETGRLNENYTKDYNTYSKEIEENSTKLKAVSNVLNTVVNDTNKAEFIKTYTTFFNNITKDQLNDMSTTALNELRQTAKEPINNVLNSINQTVIQASEFNNDNYNLGNYVHDKVNDLVSLYAHKESFVNEKLKYNIKANRQLDIELERAKIAATREGNRTMKNVMEGMMGLLAKKEDEEIIAKATHSGVEVQDRKEFDEFRKANVNALSQLTLTTTGTLKDLFYPTTSTGANSNRLTLHKNINQAFKPENINRYVNNDGTINENAMVKLFGSAYKEHKLVVDEKFKTAKALVTAAKRDELKYKQVVSDILLDNQYSNESAGIITGDSDNNAIQAFNRGYENYVAKNPGTTRSEYYTLINSYVGIAAGMRGTGTGEDGFAAQVKSLQSKGLSKDDAELIVKNRKSLFNANVRTDLKQFDKDLDERIKQGNVTLTPFTTFDNTTNKKVTDVLNANKSILDNINIYDKGKSTNQTLSTVTSLPNFKVTGVAYSNVGNSGNGLLSLTYQFDEKQKNKFVTKSNSVLIRKEDLELYNNTTDEPIIPENTDLNVSIASAKQNLSLNRSKSEYVYDGFSPYLNANIEAILVKKGDELMYQIKTPNGIKTVPEAQGQELLQSIEYNDNIYTNVVSRFNFDNTGVNSSTKAKETAKYYINLKNIYNTDKGQFEAITSTINNKVLVMRNNTPQLVPYGQVLGKDVVLVDFTNSNNVATLGSILDIDMNYKSKTTK